MPIVIGRDIAKCCATANATAPRARTRMTEGTFGDAFSASDESGFDVFAPENVSPLVAWLASPAAQDISGQVFIVWGSEIAVAQGWTPVAKIDAGGKAWSVDDL